MSKITGNIKEINWVTSWQYKCINRECPISRTPLEIFSQDEISIGTCGHGFNTKCLNDWYRQMNTKNCPVCNKKWIPTNFVKKQFQKVNNNDIWGLSSE